MSETATPTYKQTTFAHVEKELEKFENQQSAETATTETTETTVNDGGNLETQETAAAATTETAVQETAAAPVVEENVSEFTIGDAGGEQQATETTETQAAQQPVFNLDDEIKKVDRKELLKKLGVNDFTIEMDEYLAKGGKADDYLSKRAIDWNSVPDEELAKRDLKNMYPDASEQQINRLYNKKYSQQELDSEEDKEDGILLMKADARRIREAKIAEQKNFKIPDAIIPQTKDEAYEQWKQEREAQPVLMKQLSEFYQNHEATKNLNQSKRVAVNLGEGVPAFNFSINNPEAITRVFTDGGETWSKLTSNDKGEPDVAKQQLISLFTYNPNKVLQDIFNYGVQMGKKKLVEEGQNAQRPQQVMKPETMNQTSYGTGKYGDRARN